MRVVSLSLFSIILLGACSMTEQHSPQTSAPAQEPGHEAFRPAYHFTPASGWMNDPNGMVYYEGEYHLFYQHNPHDTVWGPMYWGHAISRDMVHWKHQPIALSPDDNGTIFSGSVVVDRENTSGLGSRENPPMVALFTYHHEQKAKQGRNDFQTQGLAYSLDKGRSWKKYPHNPVMANPGIRDFRDPKVSWYGPQQKWIMALAQDDHIGFYSSKNLIDWKHESNFGQKWGNHGGVWECPDLIRVRIAGTDQYKYVLLVSINPGAPNGGSGTQYFVGDFDGSHFVLEDDYQQQLVPTPDYFPEGEIFEDFSRGLGRWQVKGDAFIIEPTQKAETSTSLKGHYLLNSFGGSDKNLGSMLSDEFEIRKPYINFSIAGGKYPDEAGMQLLVEDEVVHSATGNNSATLQLKSWNVSGLTGKKARLRILDSVTGDWGHIKVGSIGFADEPAKAKFEPAVWLDYGTDNYAGVTFANVPEQDGRNLFIGWMSNWQYANLVPTSSWRSAMTVPRTLELTRTDKGLRLQSKPVAELDAIQSGEQQVRDLSHEKQYLLHEKLNFTDDAYRLKLTIKPGQAKLINILMASEVGEETGLLLDVGAGRLHLDRKRSGLVDFEPGFASVQHGLLEPGLESYQLDILVDRSSIEVFVNEGQSVISALVFPTRPYNRVTINADQQVTLEQVLLYRMGEITQ